MAPMDRETVELLGESLRQLLQDDDDRSLMDRLFEFGWEEATADDPIAPLLLLFELKGSLLHADDVLNATLIARLAEALGDDALAAATLVLPDTLSASSPALSRDGNTARLAGIALTDPGAGALVLPIEGGIAIAKTAGRLERSPVEGFDPDGGLVGLRGALPVDELVLHQGAAVAAAWESTVGRARWLVAAELLGVGRRVLEDAVAYTITRKQYGVAIGSFQALQHRMASAHASLVGAGRVVDEAAASGSPWVATLAKALAGRASEEACTQAQQAWGALGFTWEQDFHRYLRRCYALDRLFGDYRTLEFEIGAELQTSRRVTRVGSAAGVEG